MPSRTPGGGLPALPENLAPEVRALANFLRRRFAQLRISPREYGRMHNWDADAILGFLGGSDIPPQDFIDILLNDIGLERSTEEVNRDHKQSTRLREAALLAVDTRKAEQERLERELSRVQNMIRLAEARERDLTSKLTEKEAEYESLRISYEQLKAAQRGATNSPKQLERYQPKLNQLDRERNQTEKEIKHLRVELNIEKTARAAAEQKQDELRAELDRARMQVRLAGGSIAESGRYRPRALTIWGGVKMWPIFVSGSLIMLYTAFYLGLVYHLLSAQQLALKLLTISGFTLPALLLLIMARVGHGEVKYLLRYLTIATFLTISIFFIGAFI